WTPSATEQAAQALDGFRQAIATAQARDGRLSVPVLEALADDLNTPQAIVELNRLAAEARNGNFFAACDLKSTCRFLWLSLNATCFKRVPSSGSQIAEEAGLL